MVLTSTSQHSTDSVQGVDFCIVFRLNKKKHIRKYSPKTEQLNMFNVACKNIFFSNRKRMLVMMVTGKKTMQCFYMPLGIPSTNHFFSLSPNKCRDNRKPNESTAHKLYAKNTFILQLYTCFELFIFLLARFLWLAVHFLA